MKGSVNNRMNKYINPNYLNVFETKYLILSSWCIFFLFKPVVDMGCWQDQPTEASQSEGHHEPAGWSIQTWWEPHHQYSVQDPTDGHLRYTHTIWTSCSCTCWHDCCLSRIPSFLICDPLSFCTSWPSWTLNEIHNFTVIMKMITVNSTLPFKPQKS